MKSLSATVEGLPLGDVLCSGVAWFHREAPDMRSGIVLSLDRFPLKVIRKLRKRPLGLDPNLVLLFEVDEDPGLFVGKWYQFRGHDAIIPQKMQLGTLRDNLFICSYLGNS
jgi:hypothetical protein